MAMALTLLPVAVYAATPNTALSVYAPFSLGTGTRLATRMVPLDVCHSLGSSFQRHMDAIAQRQQANNPPGIAYDWVGRFCNTCDESDFGPRFWYEVCWASHGQLPQEQMPSNWDWIEEESSRNPNDDLISCIEPRLKQPGGINPERLPNTPGHMLTAMRLCPNGYHCVQMVDPEMDPHVFCASDDSLDFWDRDWLMVDSHGVLHRANQDDIHNFHHTFFPPGWHPDQVQQQGQPPGRTGRPGQPNYPGAQLEDLSVCRKGTASGSAACLLPWTSDEPEAMEDELWDVQKEISHDVTVPVSYFYYSTAVHGKGA